MSRTAKGGGIRSVRAMADSLGLSVATISRALNDHPDVAEETRARVLELADRSGYAPRVGRKPTNLIGMVYPSHPVRADFGTFESAVLAGVMRGINERRFDVTLINIERDRRPEESYTQFFRRKGLRGVLVRSIGPTPRLAEEIAEEDFPCVLLADRSDSPKVNFICSDSYSESVRAIEHLIYLGHRRIAIGVHRVLDSDHRDRLNAYREALTRAGIEIDEGLIVKILASTDGGRATIDRLLQLKRPPTGIFFTDPQATLGALHRCLELGVRVPADLSIVGFDDSDVRRNAFPAYTAVCQDAAQMGFAAARWLTRLVEGVADGPLREHWPTTLEVNTSTGPPPGVPIRLASHGVVRSET